MRNKHFFAEVVFLPNLVFLVTDVQDLKRTIYIENSNWRRKWQPIPAFLPEKSHGQKSLVGYSPKGCKELDTTERLNMYLFLAM